MTRLTPNQRIDKVDQYMKVLEQNLESGIEDPLPLKEAVKILRPIKKYHIESFNKLEALIKNDDTSSVESSKDCSGSVNSLRSFKKSFKIAIEVWRLARFEFQRSIEIETNNSPITTVASNGHPNEMMATTSSSSKNQAKDPKELNSKKQQ